MISLQTKIKMAKLSEKVSKKLDQTFWVKKHFLYVDMDLLHKTFLLDLISENYVNIRVFYVIT
jgi:hypothetical protein